MGAIDNWIIQVRKGVLELAILNALAERERYGYDLVRMLREVPGLDVTEGTLYPLLSRLRVQGFVKTRLEESPDGPARKYYSLAPEGRRNLRLMNTYLDQLVSGCKQISGKDV